MKIYTKKGDKGYTSLLGGSKVSKHHHRIDAYGTVDELNSFVGLARDGIKDKQQAELLNEVQRILFNIGAQMATTRKEPKMQIPEITKADTEKLEKAIDELDKQLQPLEAFILPGGHPSVSWCHIARTVCRRAERKAVALADVEELDANIVIYLNRLSDYFFTLARKTAKDLNVDEIKWK